MFINHPLILTGKLAWDLYQTRQFINSFHRCLLSTYIPGIPQVPVRHWLERIDKIFSHGTESERDEHKTRKKSTDESNCEKEKPQLPEGVAGVTLDWVIRKVLKRLYRYSELSGNPHFVNSTGFSLLKRHSSISSLLSPLQNLLRMITIVF